MEFHMALSLGKSSGAWLEKSMRYDMSMSFCTFLTASISLVSFQTATDSGMPPTSQYSRTASSRTDIAASGTVSPADMFSARSPYRSPLVSRRNSAKFIGYMFMNRTFPTGNE